ncbi:hypothetical protein MHU86_4852 [Fragilaria crotonensis]|nr:hypothetical protein MHU86_4852 [Fragilaria crotonensis]
MMKSPAYAVVADSESSLHNDIVVHGKAIAPLVDRRKRELGLAFVTGTVLGGLLLWLLLLASGSFDPQAPAPSLLPVDVPTVSHSEANGTAIHPLKPPPQNETQSAQQQQQDNDQQTHHDQQGTHGNENPESSSWWSAATSTVSGWFGGGDAHHPTKLAGGGRDWLVDAQTGTVAAKLNPTFRLAVGPALLVLVPSDSERALFFLQSPTASVHNVDLVVDPNGEFVGFPKETPATLEGFEYFDTVVSPFVEPLSITYKEDNFLVYDDEYVLDVSFWKIVEGQTVNFVKALDGSTFTTHGGRDWIWNENGSLSPKLNKALVLGRGPQTLIITQREDQALHLSHAQELANGETVPMELAGAQQGIDAKEVQTTSDGWLYRETVLVNKNPIRIKYDGNFILTSDENFALDIAEWKLEQDNVVTFVGGND